MRPTDRHRQIIRERGPLRPSEVQRLREELEGLKARSAEIEAALDIVPKWRPGITVEAGQRYRHDDNVWVVIQPHTTQADWPPPDVPALFERDSS